MRYQWTMAIVLACLAGWMSAARADEKAAEPAPTTRDKATAAMLERELPEINFNGQGFADVMDFLRDVSGTNIFINWKALESTGITKDTAVASHLKNVKFKAVLSTILEVISTTKGAAQYTVEDGVIVISIAPDPKHPLAGVTGPVLPEKLDRGIPEINFAGQGLSDVIDFVRDVTGVNVAVNWNKLKEAGIEKDAPVTARLKDVRVSTALRRIMESVSDGKTPLVCTFKDGVVMVTTGPKVEKPAK